MAGPRQMSHIWFRLEQPGLPDHDVLVGQASSVSEPVMIASLSKSVTGIAAALLIQDHKLRLDSNLGDILPDYFRRRGQTLDPSLRPITIARLLTHTAGLRTNHASDPVRGINSKDVLARLAQESDAFEYLMAADAARSNGSADFVYSNISYLLLGLSVEAVTGQPYEAFCRARIFTPLGITRVEIPPRWRKFGPFAGWQLSVADLLVVWRVLDVGRPGILAPETLRSILLAKLGQPTGRLGDLYYAMGAFVRQTDGGRAYVLTHNGIGDYYQPSYFSFVEKNVPGVTWALAMRGDSIIIRGVPDEVRNLVQHSN
jgi:D-alanyl-D-alanine carboxypeptidase